MMKIFVAEIRQFPRKWYILTWRLLTREATVLFSVVRSIDFCLGI